MASTTAQQLSVSYLSKGDPKLVELLVSIARLANPEERLDAAQALADRLGCRKLIIFIEDSELHVLLPAPGFVQTLPQARRWRAFLSQTLRHGRYEEALPFPSAEEQQPALGVAGEDGSVMVLLGGAPQAEQVAALRLLLPLVAAALRGERAVATAAGHATVAQQTARQASALTRSLDAARKQLQDAYSEANAAHRRAAFLAEASTLLVSSLNIERTIGDLARLVVPQLADTFVVELADEQESLSCLIREPSDGPAVELHSSCAAVLRDSRPLLFPHPGEASQSLISLAGEEKALLKRSDISSALAVPLTLHSRSLGTLILLRRSGRNAYTLMDLDLCIELGRRVAVAIENAELYRRSQEAIAVRDQFLSVAAHELKTPVTTLLGYAQLLQRRLEQEGLGHSRSKNAVEVLYQQARRLHRLSLTLLDLSHIQADQLAIDLAEIDLGRLAARLIAELQQSAPRHQFKLIAPAEPLPILGDALRLEQVLYNLVSNAIKFSPEGGRIEVWLERRDRHACVSVSDHGIGIPAEALPQLFDRFYRAANVYDQQIDGIGLGLYIVKELTARHGGRVEVSSQEGHGSTFRLLLPLLEAGTDERVANKD